MTTSMTGELLLYTESPRRVAFQTGTASRVVVFIGGLTDGACPRAVVSRLNLTNLRGRLQAS